MKLTNYRRSLLIEYHLSGYSIIKFLNSRHTVGSHIKVSDFKSWLKLEREEIAQQEAFESTVIEISKSNITLQKTNQEKISYKKLKTSCSNKILSLPQTRRNIWMINMVLEVLK
jgi:hypothetical protein